MQSKSRIVDGILVLLLSMAVIFAWMTQSAMGLWEPWEATTVLLSRQMSQSSFVEMAFWVPQYDGEIVFRPYLQLWSLAIMHHIYQEPGAFLMRLPGALAALYMLVLGFLTIRQVANRRVAWLSVLVLLTMPMFVLGAKVVHGGIWVVFAVTVPILHYLLAAYANSRRMSQIMHAFFAFSLLAAFLAGGFFALAILAVVFGLFFLVIRKHPQRESFYWPVHTKYFAIPLYLSFLLIVLCFGQYTIHVRAALEGRQALSLAMLNEALEEGRVEDIQSRGAQVIGQFKLSDASAQASQRYAFVLAEGDDGLKTKASEILMGDEIGRRQFEQHLLAQFGSKELPKAVQDVAPFDGALKAAFNFFWYNSMGRRSIAGKPLARVSAEVIEAYPRAAFIHKEASTVASSGKRISSVGDSSGYLGEFRGGEIVEVLKDSSDGVMSEIRYQGQDAYVDKLVLNDLSEQGSVRYLRWAWIIGYGLFPWIVFFPLFLGILLLPQNQLPLNPQSYRLNFMSYELAGLPELRSPLQSLLAIWFFVAVLALFIGTNFTNHYSYVGMVPVAVLSALVMSTPKFWSVLRAHFELRFLAFAVAFGFVCYLVYELFGSPFFLIQYLLTDPHIHWPSSNTSFETIYLSYIPIFGLLCVSCFSPVVERWRQQLYKQFVAVKNAEKTSGRQNLVQKSPVQTAVVEKSPVFSIFSTAFLVSIFVYAVYFPSVSQEMTETSLIERYVELSNKTGYAEKLFVLHDETLTLCRSYRDCDPGYICQDEYCKVSSFSGYSLSAAHDITHAELLEQLNPYGNTESAFFIIPKALLLGVNQSYRRMFTDIEERRNVYVTDAQSSRLYLINNDKGFEEATQNPYDNVFLSRLPQNANATSLSLGESLELEGFRIEGFSWQIEGSLNITLFYRLKRPIYKLPEINLKIVFPSRTVNFKRTLFGGKFSPQSLVEGDLLADTAEFNFILAPTRGLVDLEIQIHDESHENPSHHLTTIDF